MKIKCQPGGISLIPWKAAVVVKDRRSMPHRLDGERSSRSAVGVQARGEDMAGLMALVRGSEE